MTDGIVSGKSRCLSVADYILRVGDYHISSFQVFDLAVIMTEGGPANATNTIVYVVYLP